MWYIVLIDIEKSSKHQAIECNKDAEPNEYTETVGYLVAGKFQADSEARAIELALQSDPAIWEGCVA